MTDMCDELEGVIRDIKHGVDSNNDVCICVCVRALRRVQKYIEEMEVKNEKMNELVSGFGEILAEMEE